MFHCVNRYWPEFCVPDHFPGYSSTSETSSVKPGGFILNRRKQVKTRGEFICKVCGRVFQTDGGMRLHERVHTDQAFVCEVCEKRFSSQAMFTRHIWTHSSERLICEWCWKSFSGPDTLRQHKQRSCINAPNKHS